MVFDLDDTLILDTGRACYRAAAESVGLDPESIATVAEQTARALWRDSPHVELGVALGIASWEVMWAEFTGGHPCLDGLQAWAPSYRRQVWEATLAKSGAAPDLAPEIEQAYIRAHHAGHPQIPGAVDLLRRLHASGVPVGILTNGPPDIQRLKLAQLDATECFSATVISGEVGVGKPDPAVFKTVLDGLGTEPATTVMIGDSWNRDIEGAEAVGMRSVWISNGRKTPRAVEGLTVVNTTSEAGVLLGC